MPPINFSSIAELEQNSPEVFSDAISVLIRIAGNIIKDPKNPKFRSLSLGSNVFSTKLLPASGAVECLFEMGFVEAEDKLELPLNASLEKVKKIYDDLVFRRDKNMAGPSNQGNRSVATPVVQTQNNLVPVEPAKPKVNKTIQDLTAYQHSLSNNFLKNLVKQCIAVLSYEAQALQIQALKCIPMIELNLEVEQNIRKLQRAVKKGILTEPMLDYQELLLLSLLKWFKNSFFEWVDTVKCGKCGQKTVAAGMSNVLVQDAERVEKHVCQICGTEELFPRYNNPGKLLETRRGRCGEWANCFTLLCRAIGWDARFVVDSTDHVWSEVYIHVKNTWVHCDPCENIMDAPLLYEVGWKKKLSYVVGYSREGVQDVTWRYSSQHREVLARRDQCMEAQLLEVISTIREIMTGTETPARKAYITKRCALELVELMKPRKVTAAETKGRSSGALEWRLTRGDTHVHPFVWHVQDTWLVGGAFMLQYCTSKDEYHVTGTDMVVKGWQNGVQVARSVFRKEEQDWRVVYLARADDAKKGLISWKFDVGNKTIDTIDLRFERTLFQSGQVSLRICSGDVCVRIPSGNFQTTAFQGVQTVTVTAELSGGDGDCAWQHAQLFRQQVESCDTPFVIRITVK